MAPQWNTIERGKDEVTCARSQARLLARWIERTNTQVAAWRNVDRLLLYPVPTGPTQTHWSLDEIFNFASPRLAYAPINLFCLNEPAKVERAGHRRQQIACANSTLETEGRQQFV